MKTTARVLDKTDFESWNRFVAACPIGSVYSDTRYLEVLSQAVNCRFRVIALERDGQFVAGIALFEQPTRWGMTLGPRVLLQYNGFVESKSASSYPSQQTADAIHIGDSMASVIEQQGYGRAIIKLRWPFQDVRPFTERGWSAEPTYTYVVPLGDLDSQWKLVDRNLKRLIRRCRNEGMTVTEDGDFESFYRMHRQTHDRKGSPIYLAEDKFLSYFQQLHAQGIARLYHARLPDGTSVAAQLVLAGDHPVSDTVSACADDSHLSSGASAFLRWSVFERLADDGFLYNDLTNASLDSVSRFKSQFGGELRVCFALTYPSSLRFRIGSRIGKLARTVLRRQ